MQESENKETLQSMPLTQHFLEFRKRLIFILLGIVLCIIALFPFMQQLFDAFSKPLMQVLPEDTKLLSVSVIAPVLGPLKILLFSAICLSLPFTTYQIWQFCAPALYKKEKSVTVSVIISSIVMFSVGVAYCYFVVFGFLFKFIASISPSSISFAPDISSYISFVLHMFFAFGVCFEIPVIVVLLAKLNFVTPTKLKKFRRYLIVISFAIAAVITPPDIASQLLLALPIIFLYEIGIFIASVACRKECKTEEQQNLA